MGEGQLCELLSNGGKAGGVRSADYPTLSKPLDLPIFMFSPRLVRIK